MARSAHRRPAHYLDMSAMPCTPASRRTWTGGASPWMMLCQARRRIATLGVACRSEVGMSTSLGPAAGTGGTRPLPRPGVPTPGGRWDLGAGDPATVVAQARTALFVMVGVLAALWVIQIANWADHYHLAVEYGIRPRDLADLPDILTAPFLHFSWAHIEGNSGPLFIFGFLAAYRGVAKFLGVTAVVILASGLGAWLTESAGTVGAGASGVVFG